MQHEHGAGNEGITVHRRVTRPVDRPRAPPRKNVEPISTPIELSIVICTRNRAAKLDGMLNALANIRSSRTWEVLLVDNNSTDHTILVLENAKNQNHRIRVLKVEQVGLGAARNVAWRHTQGSVVAFTDDDCYVAEDFVDQVLNVFEERPEISGIGGRILLFDPTDFPITIDERTIAEDIAPNQFVRPGALAGANMAFRRRALVEVDGLDPMFGAGTPFPCEDIDLVAAICWAGMRQAYDPRPVVFHHHGRKANDVPALMQGYDRGRGAYFAKYLLRRDSRKAYYAGWKAEASQDLYVGGLCSNFRELVSAFRYLQKRKAYIFAMGVAPVALYCMLRLAARAILAKVARAARRL